MMFWLFCMQGSELNFVLVRSYFKRKTALFNNCVTYIIDMSPP